MDPHQFEETRAWLEAQIERIERKRYRLHIAVITFYIVLFLAMIVVLAYTR